MQNYEPHKKTGGKLRCSEHVVPAQLVPTVVYNYSFIPNKENKSRVEEQSCNELAHT